MSAIPWCFVGFLSMCERDWIRLCYENDKKSERQLVGKSQKKEWKNLLLAVTQQVELS